MSKSLKENFLEISKKFGKPYNLQAKGIKRSIIQSILKGSMLKINEAYEVAKVLGVSLEELYTGGKKIPPDSEPLSGIVNETQEPYGLPHQPYSGEERHYIGVLIEILRGANQKNAGAIKENLEAFHISKDMPVSAADCEPNNKKKRQSC